MREITLADLFYSALKCTATLCISTWMAMKLFSRHISQFNCVIKKISILFFYLLLLIRLFICQENARTGANFKNRKGKTEIRCFQSTFSDQFSLRALADRFKFLKNPTTYRYQIVHQKL